MFFGNSVACNIFNISDFVTITLLYYFLFLFAGAINQAQGLTSAIGYATGKDMSGVQDALGTAANVTGQVQAGMTTAENVGKNLQKKNASGLAMSGLKAYGDYRTRNMP